jgi:NADH dehydrogenase FAD-containing subunit
VPEASLPTANLFAPLSSILSRYPSTSYSLIIGTAVASDFASKTVTVSLPSESGSATPEQQEIPYDHLVIATGSRTASPPSHPTPWKADGTYPQLLSLLASTSSAVSAANHIVVAGAGPTGVELAAELAYDNPSRTAPKCVLLLGADPEILRGDSIASSCRAELKRLGVGVRTGVRVESVRPGEGGKTEVVLSGGEVLSTDLYLPTVGLVPNTEFVADKYKDGEGRVVVDRDFSVLGAQGVWAAGDVVGRPRCGFLITQKQVSCSTLVVILDGREERTVLLT